MTIRPRRPSPPKPKIVAKSKPLISKSSPTKPPPPLPGAALANPIPANPTLALQSPVLPCAAPALANPRAAFDFRAAPVAFVPDARATAPLAQPMALTSEKSAQAQPLTLPAITIQFVAPPPASDLPLLSYAERHGFPPSDNETSAAIHSLDNAHAPHEEPSRDEGRDEGAQPLTRDKAQGPKTLCEVFGLTGFAELSLQRGRLSEAARVALRKSGGWESITLPNFNFVPAFNQREDVIWLSFNGSADVVAACRALGADWFRVRAIPLPACLQK